MIPEEFKKEMKSLQGLDFDSFINALENGSAVRALRVNTLKISDGDFLKCVPFETTPVSFVPHGFIFQKEKVGSEPLHHAGAFYVQDPSAMCAVAAAAEYIPDDALILDMCAAPGGKTTQLAALCPNGFIVSNEIVPSRARILRGNLERMGVKNVSLTSKSADFFTRDYAESFDAVICDAPCSGEGMMRKYNKEASENWSPENVALCAARQKEILDSAALCTAPGGILIYSTCTFNLSENEMTVDSFLSRHEDFSIVPADEKIVGATSDGINFEGHRHNLTCCRRFYPHLGYGEGQFVCVMRRQGERTRLRPDFSFSNKHSGGKKRPPATLRPLSQDERETANAFFGDCMGGIPDGYFPAALGNTVMLCPENAVCPDGSLLCGVAAGEVIKGRFQPHHHLFSAFGKDFLRKILISSKSEQAEKYLRGETPATDCQNGFCAVLIDGCPVGGAKSVDGVAKNHYPKGLRLAK